MIPPEKTKNVSVQDILGALFDAEETVCFRVFDDRKSGSFSGAKISCECGKYTTVEGELRAHNAMNRGVFFVVNYGGQDDHSIRRINAQFVEMDDDSFEEQEKRINAFPLPPSMIIRTRRSYHVYWFMDGSAAVENFRRVQKLLVNHFRGDPMCVNESRVMRLPGFYHCKENPVKVECMLFHPEIKYSQKQLLDSLTDGQEKTIPKRFA